MRRGLMVCVCMLLLAGCASVPPQQHNPLAVWTPSPNFDARRASMIVLHYTQEVDAKAALHTLRTRNPGGPVSAHFMIGNYGTIYQLVAEGKRAWQAGTSWWGATDDLNSRSIGIEIDNNGAEPYPQVQIDALIRLLDNLTQHLDIPRTAIVGHADVAPTRRADPGVFFPWSELAAHGLGLWYDAGTLPNPPAGFDPLVALKVIGYDVTDPTAAIIAWHRHFRANSNQAFDATDLRILYDLERKVMQEGQSKKDPDMMPPAPPFASLADYKAALQKLGPAAVEKIGQDYATPGTPGYNRRVKRAGSSQ